MTFFEYNIIYFTLQQQILVILVLFCEVLFVFCIITLPYPGFLHNNTHRVESAGMEQLYLFISSISHIFSEGCPIYDTHFLYNGTIEAFSHLR